MAGNDFDKAQRVQHWPLHEVLYAYQEICVHHAIEAYRHSCMQWALMPVQAKAQIRPPKKPRIIDDGTAAA